MSREKAVDRNLSRAQVIGFTRQVNSKTCNGESLFPSIQTVNIIKGDAIEAMRI
jgi:hypothetical protein